MSVQTATATTYYISPTGSNSNSGTSAASPWKTFAFAIPKLQPGDTLMLSDGTYTGATTGYLTAVCGSNASNGTQSQPITVKAINERKAFLDGDGTDRPMYVYGCSYWVVEGLHARSGDFMSETGDEMGSVFVIKKSSNVTLRRSIGEKPNRYKNAHPFKIVDSIRILLEENEGYTFHRHGISAYNSSFITLRRNYSNARNYPTLPGYSFGPQEGMTIYLSNDSIIENNIVEGSEEASNTGSRNQLRGNIVLGASIGFAVGHHCCVDMIARDNVYVDNIAVSNNYGFLTQSETKALFLNNSAIGNNQTGFIGNNKYSSPNGASWTVHPDITVQNGLSFGNGNSGFFFDHTDQFSALVLNKLNAHSNRYDYDSGTSNRTDSLSVNPLLGSCKVYIPANSPLKGAGANGADIGANVLYRYIDGALTNQPLWDPQTGGFTCGAVVAGLNDVAGASCADVHSRLNVNSNGCLLPAGYGQLSGMKTPTRLRIPQ